jgi:hypothetical protein
VTVAQSRVKVSNLPVIIKISSLTDSKIGALPLNACKQALRIAPNATNQMQLWKIELNKNARAGLPP